MISSISEEQLQFVSCLNLNATSSLSLSFLRGFQSKSEVLCKLSDMKSVRKVNVCEKFSIHSFKEIYFKHRHFGLPLLKYVYKYLSKNTGWIDAYE